MGPFERDDQAADFPARIRDAVQYRIVNGRRLRTLRDLVQDIATHEKCPRSLVHSVIRKMIEEGRIEYRYTFGQSYLALSFRRPVDLTPRFTIVPPGYTRKIPPPRIPVAIAPGIAFGDGRHPTTRLALQALDRGWAHLSHQKLSLSGRVLDIGTGSGILALAAAGLGATSVMALDIDACARVEARHNVQLNPYAVRTVQVANHSLASIEGPFDLIMANLRLPTLVGLAEWVREHLMPLGCMVVSGCREEEWDRLVEVYVEKGIHSLWRDAMGGWAGGLLKLEDPTPPLMVR